MHGTRLRLASNFVSASEVENTMAHNHGNEYQVKIVHEDGIEELSEWMNSQEQVIQAMLRSTGHKAGGLLCLCSVGSN